MVLSILDNTTVAFDMEAVSDNGGTWTAFGSASALGLNEDIFKVGTGSIDAKLDGGAGGAQGGMQITRGTPFDFDDAGTDRGMVAIWCFHTGTIGANGIRLRVGSDASNFRNYTMSTIDGSIGIQYNGGFVRMVVDISKAATSTTGSPVMSACDYFAIEFDTDTDIMGNIPTIWVDQMNVLDAAQIAAGTRAFEVRGTTVTAGSAIDELAALTTVTDLGAIVKAANGSFDLNMPVKFGDTTAATNSTITSTNEYLFIPAHHFGSGFCTIEFDGGTGTNVATWGAETGSGDDTVGSTGGAIVGTQDGTNGNFKILCDASDATTNFFGVVIDGADSVSLSQTNVKCVSVTFANCGSISLDVGNAATMRDGTVTDSIAISGVGAIILVGNPAATADFRDMLIQNCIHGIENEVNGPITWDLRNIKFAGNTADIRFNHASGLLTVNVLELGDTPSTSDGGSGGTITIVNAVNIDIHCERKDNNNDIQNVRVLVRKVSDGSTISTGLTDVNGDFSDTFDFTSDEGVEIEARKSTLPIPRFFAEFQSGTITSNGLSTNFLMREDKIAVQS